MYQLSKEFVLYGIKHYENCFRQIMADFNHKTEGFEIELLLSEALLNAFQHGNREDNSKPILLRYERSQTAARFSIEDCGSGFEQARIPTSIDDNYLLDEGGRGLWLINTLADKVEIQGNVLKVEKFLK